MEMLFFDLARFDLLTSRSNGGHNDNALYSCGVPKEAY